MIARSCGIGRDAAERLGAGAPGLASGGVDSYSVAAVADAVCRVAYGLPSYSTLTEQVLDGRVLFLS
jgi:hypothetical protein